MAAPKYIKAKAEQLDKALAQVRKLAAEIEEWADKQEGVEGQQFFYDNRLDMAYEYELSNVLANLDAAANGEYDYCY